MWEILLVVFLGIIAISTIGWFVVSVLIIGYVIKEVMRRRK